MASNLQAFKIYAKIGIACSALYYIYLYNRCKKIRIEYTDFDMIQNKKDTTRPSNVYYGINWGYRSDETMEKSLDTGDLLFYNFDCNKCFSPRDTLICKVQQNIKRINPDKSANAAFCFRANQHRVLIITDFFGLGEISILPYHEFLNKPFIKMVKTRQIIPETPPNLEKNTLEFLKNIRLQKQKYDLNQASSKIEDGQSITDMSEQNLMIGWTHRDFFEKMQQFRFEQLLYKQESKGVVQKYLQKIEVLNLNKNQVQQKLTIAQLDTDKPEAFAGNYRLSQAITIRSYNSRDLNKNSNLV